jgi:hypothetical protein
MNQDAPTTATESPAPATTRHASPRHLAADHPVLMRAGIITFVVGMVNAIFFGVLTNIFTHEAMLLDNFRRVGLAIMLVGMVLVLYCFPTGRKALTFPATVFNRIAWSAAAKMIVIYCVLVFVVLMTGVVSGFWLHHIPVLEGILLLIACIAASAVSAPRGSRPFFVAALFPALLMAIPAFVSYTDMWRRYYSGSSLDEQFFWLMACGGGTVLFGFIGLAVAWLAKILEPGETNS